MPHQQHRLVTADQFHMAKSGTPIQRLEQRHQRLHQCFQRWHQDGALMYLDQVTAAALPITHIQHPKTLVPAHRQPSALAVTIGRTQQGWHPLLRLQTGEMLQLLGQRLLLDL